MRTIKIGKDKIEVSILENSFSYKIEDLSDASIMRLTEKIIGTEPFPEFFTDNMVYGFSEENAYGGIEYHRIRG